MINVSYINEGLNYPINSLGYRDVEFDNINWSETYVMQGCSLVCGVAITDNEQTLPSLLSARLNEKVVNLGVLGSSIQLQYMNAVHMIEQNIIPKGVFVLYPFTSRFLTFHNRGGRIIQYGPSFAYKKDEVFTDYLSKADRHEWMVNNAKSYNDYFLRGYKLLWKGVNVPVYEIGLEEGLADHTFLFKDAIDTSDGLHWGPLTNAKIAETFETILNENTE